MITDNNQNKYIIIVGFRWSGSSAAAELISENFKYSEIYGDEFLPLSFGLLPILYPDNTTVFKRFISLYFMDPEFRYLKISRFRKYLTNIIVFILSVKSHWLKDYNININRYFKEGYKFNDKYGALIASIQTNKTAPSLKTIIDNLIELTHRTNPKQHTILLNNIIPGNYHEALCVLNEFENIQIACVKRTITDQMMDIRRNSMFGRYLPKFLLRRSIEKMYGKLTTSKKLKILRFEDLVLSEVCRNTFLTEVEHFGNGKRISRQFTNKCLRNSHRNISAEFQ